MTAGDPPDAPERPRYQPFFCEENVFQLARAEVAADGERVVLVISNTERTTALWAQRAGRLPDGLVVWDYHVVLAARREAGWDVLDLDSMLGSPVALDTWLDQTFLPLPAVLARFEPRFRLVEASTYVAEFTSDRSHMRTETGEWQKPPPPWPAIDRPELLSFLRWTLMSEGDDSLAVAELRERL